LFRGEPMNLGDFGRRVLAEGDSWFTIGTLNLPEASNILFKLEFTKTTVVVNSAYPGATLRHVVDSINDVYFDRLLRHKRFASFWELILISAGGNDLIDAVQVPAIDNKGHPISKKHRLLLTQAEVDMKAASSSPERYISEEGWASLATYLSQNLTELVKRRDEGPSKGRPIFLHTYAVPTVRPSGAIGRPQGWLYPAFTAYAIPEADRQGLANVLFARLRQLLLNLDQKSGQSTALANLHVFDSAGLSSISQASPNTAGKSGDWINEIHLSPEGYGKLGKAFGTYIENVLTGYP
jgi:hypothetical protein